VNWLWPMLWPWMPLLARVGGFMTAGPIFSSASVPMVVRVGLVLLVTVFFGISGGFAAMPPAEGNPVAASLLMAKELLIGLALGLSVNLIYLAVQQGARVTAQQMGMHDAGLLDPITGEESESVSLLFEMVFAMLFLMAGGHLVLLNLLAQSYTAFPTADSLDTSALAGMVLSASGSMFVLALKMAAPMLAAFLILAVVLGVLARVLPEINILLASFPLRIGLGLIMAAGMMPMLGSLAQWIGEWMMRTTTLTG